MKPKTNLDVAHKVDIEKNLEVDIQARSKSTILLITFFELACIIFLMHHREYIDSLHQMLNSILMGMFTAGFAQSVIQLYRYVNYHRLAKFYVWGAVNGVISSLWIDYLVYNFPAVSMRVAVDQCIGSPFFQAIFIIYNCIWENLDILPAFKTVCRSSHVSSLL